MIKVLATLYPWESPKLYVGDFDVEAGDQIIVAAEHGNEVAIVESAGIETREDPKEKILRLATDRDKSVHAECKKQEKEFLESCRKEIKESGLAMKLIDALVTLDGKQVIFAFTADGRIDFRELVRKLSNQFKKSVRMQQIGSRDEARKLGGYGICGRELCCVRNSGNMQSITTDMAKVQQISHRGAERISGLCGRLMCCLAYEAEQYREMTKGMPELYSSLKTADGKGTVIEINAPLGQIKVRLESGKYIIIKKEDIK